MSNTQTLERPRKKAKQVPKAAVRPRQGLPPVIPHIVCAGAAEAIAFYKKAFGAVETMRIAGPSGKLMHAGIQIGKASIMLIDEMPEHGVLSPTTLKGSPVTVHLYVDDVDAFVARAVKAGATLRMPVADMFWGDRYGMLLDPFGHSWSIATQLREMTADEILLAMQNDPGVCGAGKG
jgi:PhnB protein